MPLLPFCSHHDRAMPDARAELIWTASYALWRAQKHIPRGWRTTGWPPSIEEFRIVAEMTVVGWRASA